MILVLDDLASELQQTVSSLEIMMQNHPEYRQEIITARTREEAIETFSRNDISLAILDVVLHRATDGLCVAKQIQEKKEIPVVLVTGSYAFADVPMLRTWALDGNGRHTAVDVCGKIGYGFNTYAEFGEGLYDAIKSAEGKLGKGNDTEFYSRLIKRAEAFDSPPLLGSLKVIFKQVRAEIYHLIDSLGEEKKYFPKDITLEEEDDILHFLHVAKNPLHALGSASMFFENPGDTVKQIAAKSKTLLDALMYVSLFRLKYDPMVDELREKRAELKEKNKTAFPAFPSEKLKRRTAMLKRDSIPYLVLSPKDNLSSYQQELEDIIRVTGKVIARSAGAEDALGMQMRGFFQSYQNLENVEEISKAVLDIRSMPGNALSDFLYYHSFQAPPVPHVIIEPFYEDKFNGSIIEHPNFPGIFLVEYTWHDKTDKVNSGFLYDSNGKRLVNQGKNVIDNNALAERLIELYYKNKQEFPGEVASQMEFCFSGFETIHDLQFTDFKAFDAVGNFNQAEYLLLGKCSQEKLAVVYPYSSEQMAVVSELAKKEGYKLCVVVESGKKQAMERLHLASLPDNIGLAVTSQGLLPQSHYYFNLLAVSENALFLRNETELDKLGLRPGMILTYSSDGHTYTMDKHDDTDEIMDNVRRIINESLQ